MTETNWYAVRVKPRHEKSVARVFEYHGYQKLLPLYRIRRKWSDRIKEVELPLFPCYVFCNFDPKVKVPILNSPGVVDIVRFGPDLVAVDPDEIHALQRVVDSKLPCEPWQALQKGQLVTIDDGPLVGLSGRVIEIKNRLRLVLSVTLIQRTVLVELDGSRVRVIPERPKAPPPGFEVSYSSAQKSA